MDQPPTAAVLPRDDAGADTDVSALLPTLLVSICDDGPQ